MILFLTVIIFLLLGIIYFQYRKDKKRSGDLHYTYEKLHMILEKATNENLLVVTDDKELKLLLVAINFLLDEKKKTIARYSKLEMSMKKMLSNISHDLKTPLTVIVGYVEILNVDKTINEEERKVLLEKIHMKTLEVLDLIHKFFDLAKLESGDKDIPMTRIHMNEICQKHILSFYDLLTTQGFDVHIDIPAMPVYAHGNTEVIGRIMNNLISNAIAYGGDGKTLGITLRNDDQFVYVDIWDKGKGISESHMDKVFERMYTLEDSRNRLYQGSGLGLTITKRLVEALGGEIHLSSIPFKKTIFTVMLRRINF